MNRMGVHVRVCVCVCGGGRGEAVVCFLCFGFVGFDAGKSAGTDSSRRTDSTTSSGTYI